MIPAGFWGRLAGVLGAYLAAGVFAFALFHACLTGDLRLLLGLLGLLLLGYAVHSAWRED